MDGSLTNRPFHAEYRVGEPALIVSPTKMNVFYTPLENPISVSVPGTPQEQLSINVDNGSTQAQEVRTLYLISKEHVTFLFLQKWRV